MRKSCCEKKETQKGDWTKQEDENLIQYIQKHRQVHRSSMPKAAAAGLCIYKATGAQRLKLQLQVIIDSWKITRKNRQRCEKLLKHSSERKLIQMRIDPQTHSLGQNCTVESSFSKNKRCNSMDSNADDNRAQDYSLSSATERNTVSSLPDLNLDLNRGLPLVEDTSFTL